MRPPFLLLLLLGVGACDLPRDPEGSLRRIQGGVLRVGVAINPPWTADSAGTFGGVEPALVRDLAAELGARVEWASGGESVLLPRLHARDLDLVIGGIDATTPWAAKVGITRPYHTVNDPDKRELVWATAPGENALQVRVERFLRARRPMIDAMQLSRPAGGAR